MDVLGSRILLHPTDRAASVRFYRDTLGLAIAREFGPAEAPGTVFFLGNGLLEVSGAAENGPPAGFALWLQVRDVHAEHARLAQAGVQILREPKTEPWGLIECWIA
ncbi:MAG TPA: VOC family protein, partial [Sporichthyaceae bacterium]